MATLTFETDFDTEHLMRVFAATLSEKDLRRFAAIEARQRGYWGIAFMATVLGCSTKTIERRFFPHIARACSGILFDSIDTVVGLMRKASTATGLTTTVNVIAREYETRRNATIEMKQNLRIVYDNLLSRWNYKTVPRCGY